MEISVILPGANLSPLEQPFISSEYESEIWLGPPIIRKPEKFRSAHLLSGVFDSAQTYAMHPPYPGRRSYTMSLCILFELSEAVDEIKR